MLVQTFSPEHPAILAAVRHDYARFAAGELPSREKFEYPPFASMVRIVVRGRSETTTGQFAETLGGHVKASLASAEVVARVLGPAPAPIRKLRGHYRFQIQLHSADAAALRQAVRAAQDALKPPDEVQWIADVDPIDML